MGQASTQIRITPECRERLERLRAALPSGTVQTIGGLVGILSLARPSMVNRIIVDAALGTEREGEDAEPNDDDPDPGR